MKYFLANYRSYRQGLANILDDDHLDLVLSVGYQARDLNLLKIKGILLTKAIRVAMIHQIDVSAHTIIVE